MEKYTGTKFHTKFRKVQKPAVAPSKALIEWCHRFARLDLAEGGSGNMSIRTAAGFLVTRTAADLANVGPDDLVEVLHASAFTREIEVRGDQEPSSESLMHAAIYEARPEVQAVFHGHSQAILEAGPRLGLPVTVREQPYGTPEMAAEILKVLGKHDFLLIRNHGFVSLGASADEAGNRTEEILRLLQNK